MRWQAYRTVPDPSTTSTTSSTRHAQHLWAPWTCPHLHRIGHGAEVPTPPAGDLPSLQDRGKGQHRPVGTADICTSINRDTLGSLQLWGSCEPSLSALVLRGSQALAGVTPTTLNPHCSLLLSTGHNSRGACLGSIPHREHTSSQGNRPGGE